MKRFAEERHLMRRRMKRHDWIFPPENNPLSRPWYVRPPKDHHMDRLGVYRKYNGIGCRGCDCSLCSPSRKLSGPTIQERRASRGVFAA